MFTYLLIVL